MLYYSSSEKELGIVVTTSVVLRGKATKVATKIQNHYLKSYSSLWERRKTAPIAAWIAKSRLKQAQ
jgi:hypothetical protein